MSRLANRALRPLRRPGHHALQALRPWLAAAERTILDCCACTIIGAHWHLDTDDGAVCFRCWDTWPCPTIIAAAEQLLPRRRAALAWNVMDVHEPAHAGPRALEQCRACPPHHAWPCRHWTWASELIDGGQP